MPSEGVKNGSDRHQPLNGNSRLLLKRRTSEGLVFLDGLKIFNQKYVMFFYQVIHLD